MIPLEDGCQAHDNVDEHSYHGLHASDNHSAGLLVFTIQEITLELGYLQSLTLSLRHDFALK